MFRGRLYSEVQCIMGNGHIGPPCGQTQTTENITFPRLRWQMVTITGQTQYKLFGVNSITKHYALISVKDSQTTFWFGEHTVPLQAMMLQVQMRYLCYLFVITLSFDLHYKVPLSKNTKFPLVLRNNKTLFLFIIFA